MFPAARTTLTELRAAQLDVRLIAEGRHQPIRLASQCATSYAWLPAVLREFRSQIPAVEVRISTVDDRDTISSLLEGQLDRLDDAPVVNQGVRHGTETSSGTPRPSYDPSRVPAAPLLCPPE